MRRDLKAAFIGACFMGMYLWHYREEMFFEHFTAIVVLTMLCLLIMQAWFLAPFPPGVQIVR